MSESDTTPQPVHGGAIYEILVLQYVDDAGRRIDMVNKVSIDDPEKFTIGFVGHGKTIPTNARGQQIGPPIPLNFELPADTLQQAYAVFGDALDRATAEAGKRISEGMREMSRPKIAVAHGMPPRPAARPH